MTVDQFFKFIEAFGWPVAVAAFLIVCVAGALGFLGWQFVKGVQWCGHRLIGEKGVVTLLGARQMTFMDSLEATDSKHSESLQTIAEVMDRLTKAEDVRHAENAGVLRSIKEDTTMIRRKVE